MSKNRFFKQIQFLSRKFVPKKENCIPDAMFAFKGLKSIIKLIYGHFGFSLLEDLLYSALLVTLCAKAELSQERARGSCFLTGFELFICAMIESFKQAECNFADAIYYYKTDLSQSIFAYYDTKNLEKKN